MLTVNNNQSIKFLRVLCDLRERPIFMVSGVQVEHDDALENLVLSQSVYFHCFGCPYGHDDSLENRI